MSDGGGSECDQVGYKSSDPHSSTAESKPAAMTTTALDRDYAQIASLMEGLDKQVFVFAGSMNTVVDSASAFESLASLWRETAVKKSCAESSTRTQLTDDQVPTEAGSDNPDDFVMWDDTQDPDDPLVYI